jgi:predicted dinucleotide-binding enzyme
MKAFSCVGNSLMIDPSPRVLKDKPTMFIAGNDQGAKDKVSELITRFGWEIQDVGPAAGARPIEALCQLWCAQGFQKNQWVHAYKNLMP